MRLLAPVILALFAVMLIALGMHEDAESPSALLDAAGPVPAARFEDQDGHVLVSNRRVTRADIESWMDRYVVGSRTRYFTWDIDGHQPATATAHGTGHGHWFVNSYLVGFRPVQIEQPAMVLPLIAHKKTYTRDHIQYAGAEDIWQTSREAWITTRGDCEDHALILTDWLIEMGLNARVVIGEYRGEAHAWVVVIDRGRQYLLEATDKQTRRRPLPRVETTRGYQPAIQFNREFFWVNTGHAATRDYAGLHWERRSRFVRSGGGEEDDANPRADADRAAGAYTGQEPTSGDVT